MSVYRGLHETAGKMSLVHDCMWTALLSEPGRPCGMCTLVLACIELAQHQRAVSLAHIIYGLHEPVGPFGGPWAIPPTLGLLPNAYLLHLNSIWAVLRLIEFYSSSWTLF